MSKAPDAPFLPEEVDQIREMMSTHDAKVVCPRCGDELSTGLPIAGGGTTAMVWKIRCDKCRLGVVLSDVR